jgi:hypothetical protein
VLTTVAMATDKHNNGQPRNRGSVFFVIRPEATMGAAVFSLGSVPVMTSCNSRGSETMFSLGYVPVMTSYNRGIGGGVFFVVCSRAI